MPPLVGQRDCTLRIRLSIWRKSRDRHFNSIESGASGDIHRFSILASESDIGRLFRELHQAEFCTLRRENFDAQVSGDIEICLLYTSDAADE